jgi:large subunit ribosomal protein L4
MNSFPVYSAAGQQVDSVEVADGVFDSAPNVPLVHRALVMQRSSARQGTASTKGRGEVRGSGKKPWKQKHTGRARAGSARSPIWRHGGTVFGPKPRSYSHPLPKKMYRAALRSILAAKASGGEVIVVDLELTEMKTKELSLALTRVGASGKSVLVVDEGAMEITRIGRNIKDLKVLRVMDLNVYDLLWCEKLVITKSELQRIQEAWVKI